MTSGGVNIHNAKFSNSAAPAMIAACGVCFALLQFKVLAQNKHNRKTTSLFYRSAREPLHGDKINKIK